MAKTRPPHPPEFKPQIVEVHRAGRSVPELAQWFEPSDVTIREWVKQEVYEGLRTELEIDW